MVLCQKNQRIYMMIHTFILASKHSNIFPNIDISLAPRSKFPVYNFSISYSSTFPF